MTEKEIQWACARNACHCRYYPSQTTIKVNPYPACPNCGNAEDVFPANDGGWPVDRHTGEVTAKFWDWSGHKRRPRLK
jgi:hypothetical protein